jgi:hypothetical protein
MNSAHGPVEAGTVPSRTLDAVAERVSVQVRILDYHDRILGKPVARLRERQDGVQGLSAKLLFPAVQVATN